MKNKILTILSILYVLNIFGQKHQEANLIKLDSTWGKEFFRFPSRNMDYKGIGEVRFPPKGWRNPKHDNFWSYTYAWKINTTAKISEKQLALDLVKYFNSLNNIEMNDTKNERRSYAKIKETKSKKSVSYFKGYVKIFDRFATNKTITLNVLVKSHYCKKQKKTIILFKFSPKEFSHNTWKILRKITLANDYCE